MCEIRGAIELSRRQWLQAAGATAAAGAMAGFGAPSALAGAPRKGRPDKRGRGDARPEEFRTRVALLGVAGGPSWYAHVNGVSSALVVDDSVYVVDCGDGAWQQYRNVFFPDPDAPTLNVLAALRGVFLTHLHSDHTVDYNDLLLFGAGGLRSRTDVVPVYGPGDRGSLPPLSGPAPEPPVIAPQNPTPGTVDMTRLLIEAYAADFNDRIRDTRSTPITSQVTAHDIPLPADVVAGANADPAPAMEPVEVHVDDRVRVTAILVDHRPTFPSFAYRFDTADGAVVFSGDTAPTPNLVRLARGADVLVHEVIDPVWVRGLFPNPDEPSAQAAIAHLLNAHTTIDDVGGVAAQAGVSTLVLNHLAPANNPRSRWLAAGNGFGGRLVVGEDGTQVGLGRRTRRGHGA